MIMTFDVILQAWRDEALMKRIRECMVREDGGEVCANRHKLVFDAKARRADILPLREDDPLSCRIVPKRITYSALSRMLEGDLSCLESDDITDL